VSFLEETMIRHFEEYFRMDFFWRTIKLILIYEEKKIIKKKKKCMKILEKI
jgi:hypothetical protein